MHNYPWLPSQRRNVARAQEPEFQAASMLLVKLKIDDPVDACGAAKPWVFLVEYLVNTVTKCS